MDTLNPFKLDGWQREWVCKQVSLSFNLYVQLRTTNTSCKDAFIYTPSPAHAKITDGGAEGKVKKACYI